jgi:hypothetical protein
LHATLSDIPDSVLDSAAQNGFDWVWLLGVWSVGAAGREISRSRTEWRSEYRAALPDLSEDDICGSPFAIRDYSPARELGGPDELRAFRVRLAQRGIKLLLDFVPNHVALDHPWINTHPEYFITGTEVDLANSPNDWMRLQSGRIVAHGRDPFFPGWPDTLQLNFFNADLRDAMVQQLKRVAALCDGVRCDMAMLLEPEVFSKTWLNRDNGNGVNLPHFWPGAIKDTREEFPNFLFMAEVYWGYESRLQEHGFDYTYDKLLYDGLVKSSAVEVNSNLKKPVPYQERMVRFLENHDEPRIAGRVSFDHACAAAVITYLSPGMRFFQRGQFDGKKVKSPIHLRRAIIEQPDAHIAEFYRKLLPIVQSEVSREGAWSYLESCSAWENNSSSENFVSFMISHAEKHLLVSVNLAPYRGQCRLFIHPLTPRGSLLRYTDLLTAAIYQQAAESVASEGLFIELDGYGFHIFSVVAESRKL